MLITKLEPNQVFVFGSNSTGFHGAGSAGMAMRGDSRNNWRKDPAFLKAIDAPIGSPDRIGYWAVYGISRGFQVGKFGSSYAICTIKHPGQPKSITRREIYNQLVELWKFAIVHTDLKFLITPIGQNYAGYSIAEMTEVWQYLILKHKRPDNICFI